MQIAARQSFLTGRAPLPYNAEVAYLESTGVDYVDTGVNGSSAIICDIEWSYASSSATATPFGARTTGSSNAYAITGYGLTADNDLYVNFGSISNYLYYSGYDVYAHRWRLHLENGASTLWRDGATLAHSAITVSAFSTVGTLLALALRNGEAIRYTSGVRLHKLSLTGGDAVRDYMPVRVGNGSSARGFLYDRANPTGGPQGNGLFGNAADGQGGVTGFSQFGADK